MSLKRLLSRFTPQRSHHSVPPRKRAHRNLNRSTRPSLELLEDRLVPTVISGIKFHDVDLNGIRSLNEEGLNGWTIELVNLDTNQVIDTQITMDIDLDSSGGIDPATERGAYRFENVPTGSYRVREVLQPGWRQTVPTPLLEQAFDLDQQHDFTRPGIVNWSMQLNEKWIRAEHPDGSIDYFYILPNGQLFQWDEASGPPFSTALNGTLLGTFDASFYNDLNKLINPPEPTTLIQVTNTAVDFTNVNFGNTQVGIFGQKFEDRNSNRARDADEPFLQGWTIELVNPTTGAVLESTVTDASGSYSFRTVGGETLTDGTYAVREVVQDGWRQTTPIGPQPSSLTNLAIALKQQHGFTRAGIVNWSMQLNEKWIRAEHPNGSIDYFFILPNGQLFQWDEASGPPFGTALNGTLLGTFDASFYNDLNKIINPAPAFSNNLGNVHIIEINSTTPRVEGVDFGNQFIGASIHGYKFKDVNVNGVDDSEPRVVGVTILLVGDIFGDGVIRTISTVTDTNGEYRFTGLRPGDYVVDEVVPSGHKKTTDSTVNVTVAVDQALVAEAGQSTDPDQDEVVVPELAFGNFFGTAIHGFKYHDRNGDGVWDPGTEERLQGVSITLFRDTNNDGVAEELVASTSTDANGEYSFENLEVFSGRANGTLYVVHETPPAGFEASTSTDVTVLAKSGFAYVAEAGQTPLGQARGIEVVLDSDTDGNADLAFGNYRRGSIHGVKFIDANGDGLYQEGTESPFASVTFTLTGVDAAGNFVQLTQQTDSNGEYRFLNLRPGVYTITETLPNGFVATTNQDPNTLIVSSTVEVLSDQALVWKSGAAMLPPNSPQVEKLATDALSFGNVAQNRSNILWVDDNWVGLGNGVDPDGAGPARAIGTDAFATIQAAVNAAQAGQTIRVYAGTYMENVTINKNVTLRSNQGREVTTIQGVSGAGSLGSVVVTSNTTGVRIGTANGGFTILGIDNGAPGIENAAVYFQGSHSNAIIQGNEIVAQGDHGLLTEFGATISNFVIDSNVFSGQTFLGNQPGGIGFATQFSTPNVPRQLVVMGGGAGGGNTSNITFTNNTVTGNAGGISSQDNVSQQGNTLVTIDSNGATITGNTFAGSTARFATSLRARGPSTTITGNTFNSQGLMPQLTGQVFVQNTGQTLANIAAANTFDRGVFVDGNVGTIGISLEPVLEAVGTTIAAGSTVHVLNGVYHEAPQITINADVNIVGQDRSGTIVKAAGSTGSSSNDNSRGWFLVAEGVTLNVSHMTFDGNGNNIFQAFRHRGSGTFEDVAFHDIQFRATGPNYAGTAIAAFGSASNVDVIDSIFSQIGRIGVQFFGSGTTGEFRGNTYTGKGIGNHLDYAVEVGGGAVADILNNTITNNRGIAASDGSSSAGILVTTFFGAGSSASIQNNFINGNRHGVVVGFNASDTSMVAINNNDLSGNFVSAVSSTAPEVNAECNWWGIANAAAIQAMLGGAGSANIDFMPFLTSGADTSADAGFQGDLSSCV